VDPMEWYFVLTLANAGVIGAGIYAGWRGLIRRGAFVAEERAIAKDLADSAIIFRACAGFLGDLDAERRRREAHHDHPVNPPDSKPDPEQELEVA